MIAHNGEINTLRGNANRIHGREPSMVAQTLTGDITDCFRSSSRVEATRPVSTIRSNCWSAPADRPRTP